MRSYRKALALSNFKSKVYTGLLFVILLGCRPLLAAEASDAFHGLSDTGCRAVFDRNFFGLNRLPADFSADQDGVSSRNRLWDQAELILRSISNANLVTPANYDSLFTEVSGPRNRPTVIMWQVVPAAGLCLSLPILENNIERTNRRKIFQQLSLYKAGLISSGPTSAILALSKNGASVRYPSANAFFSPRCAQQIEGGKRFVVDDLLANHQAFGFDQRSGSYFTVLADRSYYYRRVFLTSDRSHLLTLRWMDDLRRDPERLFELCAFPLELPSVR